MNRRDSIPYCENCGGLGAPRPSLLVSVQDNGGAAVPGDPWARTERWRPVVRGEEDSLSQQGVAGDFLAGIASARLPGGSALANASPCLARMSDHELADWIDQRMARLIAADMQYLIAANHRAYCAMQVREAELERVRRTEVRST